MVIVMFRPHSSASRMNDVFSLLRVEHRTMPVKRKSLQVEKKTLLFFFSGLFFF